jgi:transcriptional regulator with XRE-family HTH domain
MGKMAIIDKILSVNDRTPAEIAKALASRVKSRRLEMNLTQEGMCRRSGVNLSSYRRFERTGLVSLESLIRIALAIGQDSGFDQLFSQRKYTSIDDVIRQSSKPKKRGMRNE